MAKRIDSDSQRIEDAVLALVALPGYQPMTFRELRHQLNCPKHLVGELMDCVESLVARNRLKFGHRDTIMAAAPGARASASAPVPPSRTEPLPRQGEDWEQPQEGPTWEQVKVMFEQNQELPGPFAPTILNRIKKLAEPTEADLEGREDCRKDEVYTIDPKDARDHDDAVCVKTLPGGKRWQLDVHIADVSQYVEDNSGLDKEALNRSFTNYLPWRAVPMLPEQLSTDLCSLLDNHDRLAMSCRMVINSKGEIISYKFFEAMVNVRRFLTYEEAQELGDAGDPAMNRLKACTDALRKGREKDNLLSFDIPESRIQFDENGEPSGAKASVHLPSHSWIEECMLAANRCCAKELDENELSGMYRTHEPPEIETIAAIASWADTLGMNLPKPPKVSQDLATNLRPEIQAWLAELLKVEGLPIGLQTKIIRSMKKARYSTECMGHFALGWRHYSHFTSPIRRYADLWTHRMLKAHIRKFEPGVAWKSNSRRIATHISAREEVVMKTERSGTKSCIAWTLRNRSGDQFDAVITGVEPMGVFVQLKDPWAEGMVHVRNMHSDFYEHNPDRMELVGMRTRRVLRMGEPIRVTLLKADPVMGFVDFALAEDEEALELFRQRDARRQREGYVPRSKSRPGPRVPGESRPTERVKGPKPGAKGGKGKRPHRGR